MHLVLRYFYLINVSCFLVIAVFYGFIKPTSKNKSIKHLSKPWIGDHSCDHFTVQYAERNSLPKWALTSFPGSGVTFTRQLIEGITGIYTGSVYLDDPSPVLSKGTSEKTDDSLCGCTILDKDHEATITTLGNYFISDIVKLQEIKNYFHLLYDKNEVRTVHQQYENRAVLLLRNPMDVVFTYRNWLISGKVGKAPPEFFTGPQWEESVDYVAYAWADHAIRWIEAIEKGTVIFYEKLVGENASYELSRLLKAMDFYPIDPHRMRCTLSHRNRTDHKRLHNTRLFLDKKQQIKFMKSIHRVQQSLRRKGWPELPVHLYDLHSPPNVRYLKS